MAHPKARSGAPKPKAATPVAGPTGRFVFCPNSNTPGMHGLVARQVQRSAKGTLWFRCGCGFRGYFPQAAPVPGMTQQEVIASGGIIPELMGG